MYTLIETFVGAGGAHIGFRKKGFESRYVLDIDDYSLKTLKYNNPELSDTAFIEKGDILKVKPDNILKRSRLKPYELDVLFGGIVCKGFSLAGERSPNDERNYFYHKQIEIAKVLKPKISIIENVKGILNAKVLSSNVELSIKEDVDKLWQLRENYKGIKASLRKNGKLTKEFIDYGKELQTQKEKQLNYLLKNNYLISVIDDIYDLYESVGYRVYHKVLNSAWFGSATKRERVIIVAVRNDINKEYQFPEPTHLDKTIMNGYKPRLDRLYKRPLTVNDAIANIKIDDKDPDSLPMKHQPKTIERFKFIPQGKNITSVMEKLPEDLKISSFYSRGNTMRLDPDAPSPTLVPGHSNFPVHPLEHRSITVREAAAITGFPLNYKFFGSHTKRCELVGNAVPVPLAEAIADSVVNFLDNI
jgi:DNA (cytosine-5)-methyltransferase 1